MPARRVITSSKDKEMLIDDEYGSLPTMSIIHYQTHIGMAYEVSNVFTSVAQNGNADLILDCTLNPAWEFHLETSMAMEGDAHIFLYETPTFTGTSEVTPRCLNRNLVNKKTVVDDSKLRVIIPTTVTLVGLELTKQLSPTGTGGQASGGGIGLNERLLGRNKKYLARITNLSGQAKSIGVRFVFYQVEENG